jgi:hypothetical protein
MKLFGRKPGISKYSTIKLIDELVNRGAKLSLMPGCIYDSRDGVVTLQRGPSIMLQFESEELLCYYDRG